MSYRTRASKRTRDPLELGKGRNRSNNIARVWHGLTPKVWREEFVSYVEETAIADLGKTKGNKGAFLLTRDIGDNTEYYIISLWDSVNSIRAFAGRDIEKARYYRRDPEMLAELEPKVMHFFVAAQARGPGSDRR